MAIVISGVPQVRAAEAQALILGELAGRLHGGALHVVAHRLPNGEWTLFISDGINGELLEPELTSHILDILRAGARAQ